MGKIRQSLISVLNNEPISSTNYRIAQYLLDNHYIANHVSIDNVALNCYCSKSTVSRFARIIGYENYYELNQDLYQSTQKSQDKYNRYLNYDLKTSKEIFLGNILNAVESLSKEVREDDILRLVEYLKTYKNVAIFGNSQSQAMAQMFQNDMCLSKKIITASNLPEYQKEYISDSDSSNLIIIVSFSGQYFRKFISKQLFNQDNKPKIILITCERKMLSSSIYDDVIYLEAQDTYAYRSHYISLFLNLVAIEYAKTLEIKR